MMKELLYSDSPFSRLLVVVCLWQISFCRKVEAQLTTTFTRPVQECDIATSESGVIIETLVVEGQTVTKGQVLARLNDATLKESLRLATLRADSTIRIRAAKATLEIRKAHAIGLKDLLDKGHGNQREFDLASMQVETAIAEHELALEQQKEARIELDKIQAEMDLRVIRSPIDGVVNDVLKEPGEYIAANDPVFCTIVRVDRLRADFYLDSRTFHQLRDKTELAVKVGQDRIDSKGELVQARLVFRSATFDPKSETARISVEIENENLRFLSGSRCELIVSEASPPLVGVSSPNK